MCTPGREDAEVKLYSKAEYKPREAKPPLQSQKKSWIRLPYPASPGRGRQYLQHQQLRDGLRIALHDMSQTLDDEVFKKWERTASSVVAMPFR